MEFGGDISDDEVNNDIELNPDEEYNEFKKRKETLMGVIDEMEGYAQASEEHRFKINEIKHAIEDEEQEFEKVRRTIRRRTDRLLNKYTEEEIKDNIKRK